MSMPHQPVTMRATHERLPIVPENFQVAAAQSGKHSPRSLQSCRGWLVVGQRLHRPLATAVPSTDLQDPMDRNPDFPIRPMRSMAPCAEPADVEHCETFNPAAEH